MAGLMHFVVVSFTLFLLANCDVQQSIFGPRPQTTSLVHDALKLSKIIGDVLDDFEPKINVLVTYPASHEAVNLGNDIAVSSVEDPPVFEFNGFHGPRLPLPHSSTENLTYTLALTDPDAKSRAKPIWSEMCHWIVTNITLTPSFQSPSELISYLPPSPPPKTGKHRYVFVLLAGSQEATAKLAPPKDSKEGRQHWGYGKERTGVAKWAAQSGLEVVGANFFFAMNEKQ